MNFIAIDFETANSDSHSVCAVGLVKLNEKKIVSTDYFLIRPPSENFHWRNVKAHHLTWEKVKKAPNFKQLWPKLSRKISKVDFLIAHHAGVDRSFLRGCCECYNIKIPLIPFICTRQLAKELWHFKHLGLEHLCRHFNIKLEHHNALSDAMGCAKIFLKGVNEKNFNKIVKFY